MQQIAGDAHAIAKQIIGKGISRVGLEQGAEVGGTDIQPRGNPAERKRGTVFFVNDSNGFANVGGVGGLSGQQGIEVDGLCLQRLHQIIKVITPQQLFQALFHRGRIGQGRMEAFLQLMVEGAKIFVQAAADGEQRLFRTAANRAQGAVQVALHALNIQGVYHGWRRQTFSRDG